MKKIKQTISSLFQKFARHKIILTITIFVLGILIGVLLGWFLFKDPSEKKTNTAITNQSTNTMQSLKNRLAKTYSANKETIKGDEKSGKITKEQADLITKKLNEYYEYRKSIIGNDDSGDALRQKRQQMRKWASDNKVSNKYFVGIL